MRGNESVINVLNKLLAEELTAINQYMVHSEMCDNWGYERLHKKLEREAIDEMKHAEKIIGRILFLEGTPTVSKLNPMRIGKDVKSILDNDLAAEFEAVQSYNDAVRIALEARDGGSRELFEHNLKDEEGHVDWLESQRDQIAQMGLERFLVNQVRE